MGEWDTGEVFTELLRNSVRYLWIIARVKLNLFTGRVKRFLGVVFWYFPGKSKQSNHKILCVYNCYLAVNCSKTTPRLILALFRGDRPLLQGVEPPTPSLFHLSYCLEFVPHPQKSEQEHKLCSWLINTILLIFQPHHALVYFQPVFIICLIFIFILSKLTGWVASGKWKLFLNDFFFKFHQSRCNPPCTRIIKYH